MSIWSEGYERRFELCELQHCNVSQKAWQSVVMRVYPLLAVAEKYSNPK